MHHKIRTSAGSKAPRQHGISIAAPAAPESYSEALIMQIIEGKSKFKVPEMSLTFDYVMSSLTPGMRNLYYRSGVSSGKALYRVMDSRKRYTWYEESVSDLVSFLEKAGFKRVTYNVFSDRIQIEFHGVRPQRLGTALHVFESGIICGFLSAAKRQHMKVEEIQCSGNGASSCKFITTSSLPLYLESDGHSVLDRFVESVNRSASSGLPNAAPAFPEEYSVLSSSVMVEKEYAQHMCRIAEYAGNAIGARLRESGKGMRSIGRISEMLGLGKLSVRSSRPPKIEARFDRLRAKKEFVDISIAFIGGMVGGVSGKRAGVTASGRRSGNSYIADISA